MPSPPKADPAQVDNGATAPPSAIDRAFDLLRCTIEARGPVTLAHAASETGLAKPTAHRMLQLMVRRGLLRQDADRAYRLGPELFSLAGTVLSQVEFTQEARAGLEWLQTITPNTIHFGVLIGARPVYVEKIEGRRPYRMGSVVGMSFDMHSTSIGKVLLAFLPPERRAAQLAGQPLTRHTPKTIVDITVLERQLQEIRQRGFAIDDEENEEQIRCIGAPVFDASGVVLGGISVSAPTFHLSMEEAMSLAPAIVHAAGMISSSLGAPAAPYAHTA